MKNVKEKIGQLLKRFGIPAAVLILVAGVVVPLSVYAMSGKSEGKVGNSTVVESAAENNAEDKTENDAENKNETENESENETETAEDNDSKENGDVENGTADND